jgi:phosphoribosylglycinamide formyltransferase-1
VKNVVILISGRGSNMRSLVEADLPARIAAIVSNRPDAQGLDYARSRAIPSEIVDHRAFATRDAFDAALGEAIDRHAPDLVVLAGFTRVLTAGFVRRYAGRLLNIHPSLLPSFPGLHTHERALEAGVKVHGATVHFVTADLDHGPIVVQAAVPVLESDSADTLAARVLRQEHVIYPRAVRWFVEDRLSMANGIVRVAGGDDQLVYAGE